jgi:hypothetical protein
VGYVSIWTGEHLKTFARVRQPRRVTWKRGGAWVDAIGLAKLGLLSMAGTGFTANFDYVHVYKA